ncbi:MAG: tetratricopeptide repeat protein [Bacteroidota bacterium]
MKKLLTLSISILIFAGLAPGQTKTDTDDPLLKSGKQKYDAKNYQGAMQDFSALINKNDAQTKSYLKKKADYDKLTEYEKALIESAELLTDRPDLAKPYYYRGMCYLGLGNKTNASKDFDMAISILPKYADAMYERASLKMQEGKKDEACIEMRAAADLGSEKAKDAFEDNFCWSASMNYVKEGTTKLNLAQYDAAIIDFNLAIKLSPDSAGIYIKRGQCWYGLGKFDKAILDFTKAISLDENKPEYYYRRGLAFYSQEKFKEASEDFGRAVKLDQNYADAWLYRAYCSEGLNNPKDALYNYGQVIRIKPDDGLAYYKRGLLKRDMKDKTCCSDFKKSAALGYEDAQADAEGCK